MEKVEREKLKKAAQEELNSLIEKWNQSHQSLYGGKIVFSANHRYVVEGVINLRSSYSLCFDAICQLHDSDFAVDGLEYIAEIESAVIAIRKLE